MADSDDFHIAPHEWSLRKHRILENYLGAAAAILGTLHQDVVFVDGFAGQGRFDDGTPQSSVLAAQIARSRRERGVSPLRCINIESIPSTYDRLCEETERVAPGLVTNYLGTFAEHAAHIMNELHSSPAIMFLDTFKPDIPWAVVEPFLKRPRTDVLINFMGEAAARMAGVARGDSPGSAANAARLDIVFGPADWRSVALTVPSRLTQAICSLYRAALAQTSGYACEYEVRAVENRTYKYSIMLATKAPVAVKIINDTFYSTEGTYQERAAERQEQRSQELSRGQLSFLPALEPSKEAVDAAITDDLMTDILEVLRSQPSGLTIQQLRLELWSGQWFARATSSQHDRALRRLINEGAVHRMRSDGRDRDKDTVRIAQPPAS